MTLPDESALETMYSEALRRCDPAALSGAALEGLPRADRDSVPVLAMGKCAVSMTIGLIDRGWKGSGLLVVPKGYEGDAPLPPNVRLVLGSHPQIDEASFRAGEAVRDVATSLESPAIVLVSGGASAAVELPLEPHFDRSDLSGMNRLLVRSGLPIESINCVRKHLSAIKGGRLMEALPSGSSAWILSDVPPGRPELVGSGPTFADASSRDQAAALLAALGDASADRIAELLRSGVVPETPKRSMMRNLVLADNDTLTGAARDCARDRGWTAVGPGRQLDDDVEAAASILAAAAASLERNRVWVSGGEPVVEVRGSGAGGRCSELGLRLLRAAARRELPPFVALIASSDGRDGNSGVAGYRLRWDPRAAFPLSLVEEALEASDAHPLMSRLGEPIIMPPTGNNLRDIMLMTRG